jgi:hypothetical protein
VKLAAAVVAVAGSVGLLGATVVAGASSASGDEGHSPRQDVVAEVREATARYHDIDQATGFGELRDAAGIACIDNPAGGMGVHYVNGSRIDGVLDPAQPEVLVYEPQANGSMKLAAVEYVIFASDWPSDGPPPELFGHSFHYMPGQNEANPNRYGLDAFWALHAWVWKPNPNGMFADWNPRVTCPQ